MCVSLEKGINQWAFPRDLPTDKALKLAADHGFAAFEVCAGPGSPIPFDTEEADLQQIRRRADKLGVTLTSLATTALWDCPLSAQDKKTGAKARHIVRRMLAMAKSLGIDTVQIVPGLVTREAAYDAVLEASLNAIHRLVPEAAQMQVCLAIENAGNRFLLSPVEMRDFIDQFESGYVGACVDVGHVAASGYPAQWIRILGPRVRRIHMKDYRAAAGNEAGFVMLLEGDIDWPGVMAALRAVDYQGPLIGVYPPYRHGAETTLAHIGTALDAIGAL